MRAGYVVLTAPFTDSARYDCVIDDGGRFLRVQIKTGKLTRDGGALIFPVCSNNWHAGTRADYRGAVELFAVFCSQSGRTYLVPVEHCGVKSAMLRLKPSRNGRTAGVRWAADYEVRAVVG